MKLFNYAKLTSPYFAILSLSARIWAISLSIFIFVMLFLLWKKQFMNFLFFDRVIVVQYKNKIFLDIA